MHTPGPPRKLPERSQLKEPWRKPKSLSLYFRWSSIDEPGNPKLNNYPFFVQPGANLTSLYFRCLIRVEQGFRCLAQMCCCMDGTSSVVHWEDNTEETSQQKPAEIQLISQRMWVQKLQSRSEIDRRALLMREQMFSLTRCLWGTSWWRGGGGANAPTGNHIRKAISVSSCPPLTLMCYIPTSPSSLRFLLKAGERLIYNAPVTS